MKTILYLVSQDWFFARHFMPMARAAEAAGFTVAIATNISAEAPLAASGIRVVPFEVARASLNPLTALREAASAYRIIRAEAPDLVHCISLRLMLTGGIAARLARVPALVLAPTGLGYLWTHHGLMPRLARQCVRLLVRCVRGPRARLLFENRSDVADLGLSPDADDVVMVGGSGVRPQDFPFVPEPAAPPVKVAVVSRMAHSKGIGDAVMAVERARRLGAQVELHLYGKPDPSHRSSIPDSVLREWAARPGIHWHGHSNDVAKIWREHHVSMLLSQDREGLPRTLVESAAAGRPIVTTDVIGCRDLVRDGVDGFLVRPGDIEQTAAALVRLAASPALRQQLGAAAHERFLSHYTEDAVVRTLETLYRSLR